MKEKRWVRPLRPPELDREGREAQGSDHERQQFALVVVAGDSIHMHGVASPALVHHEPLAIGTGDDRDRLHAAAAIRRAIARCVVEMNAPEAPGAMVAMPRARCV